MILREFSPIAADMRATVGELARSDQHTDIPTSLGSASFLYHSIVTQWSAARPTCLQILPGDIRAVAGRLTGVIAGLRVLLPHRISTV
jgi:hypothetical protein